MRIGAVTIIIPCYKAAATLRRAVDSTLCGAPADTRLLLVDDGSPDSTGTLCDELASADPRITALHRANGGAGAARSTGLDAATGDWVLFLDADDELLPGLWDELAALDDTAQKSRPSAVSPVPGQRRRHHRVLAPGFYPDLSALGAALEPLLFTSGLLAAPYPKLFRRFVIGALRFDPRLQINEDVLFNLQFLQNGSAIYCLHGVYYKQNDVGIGSLSRSLRGDLLDAEAITRPALEALLTQNGIAPAPYLQTSRVRACINQYGLLTGCKGSLTYKQRRDVFARILADADARAALRARLQNDPNRLLALPYKLGLALRAPGLLAAYTLAKQRFL